MNGDRREEVARACHELRGPLTAVRLGLGLPEVVGGLPPGIARALQTELDRATLALGDLEAAVGRATPSPPRHETFDLGDLVDDVVAAAQGRARRAGVAVDGGWADEPTSVSGDRARLAQALGNLVSNAVEHGGSAVRVVGRRGGADARVEVSDAGPGLPATIPTLAARPRGGRGRRGRGLAIALAVVNEHGGTLETAPAGAGAHVVVGLPTASSGGRAAQERRDARRGSLRG